MAKENNSAKMARTLVHEQHSDNRTNTIAKNFKIPDLFEDIEKDATVASDPKHPEWGNFSIVDLNNVDPAKQDAIFTKNKDGYRLVNPVPTKGDPDGAGNLYIIHGIPYGVDANMKLQRIEKDRANSDWYKKYKGEVDARNKSEK